MNRRRILLSLEQLEDRLTPSAPAITMTFATTTDARTISVNYTIGGDSLVGQNISFNIYRTAAYNSLNNAQLIGTAMIPGSDRNDLSVGTHSGVKLALTAPNGQPVTALTPNTARPFIVVVANTDGSSASFETHVLGVFAHGLEFDPTLLLTGQVPQLETEIAEALQQDDGYEAVIPFNWVQLSILPYSFAILMAGNMLYQQVVAEANQLASQHPGDVVDINFIGHSRGTVVISEALQDLVGTTDPALRGGYMQMTLLDPHPASLVYSQFSVFLPVAGLAEILPLFEFLAQDPQVVVPPNVNRVQDFDEQTPAGQFGFLTAFLEFGSTSQLLEFGFNLWGETAASLPNQSGHPIEEQNLSNVSAANIGLIGHSEVPLWYLTNVVDTNETFTYFG